MGESNYFLNSPKNENALQVSTSLVVTVKCLSKTSFSKLLTFFHDIIMEVSGRPVLLGGSFYLTGIPLPDYLCHANEALSLVHRGFAGHPLSPLISPQHRTTYLHTKQQWQMAMAMVDLRRKRSICKLPIQSENHGH